MPCQNSTQSLDKAVYGKMYRVRKNLDTKRQRKLFIGHWTSLALRASRCVRPGGQFLLRMAVFLL